jgi:hypothetical protein
MKIQKNYFRTDRFFKLLAALYIIGTSIYDIKQDFTDLKKEHGLLIIGCISLAKTFLEMKKKMSELPADITLE